MAGGSNTLTSLSDLQKGWRKKTTKLYTAFKDKVEEFSWVDDIDDEDITPSGRENLVPLDIVRGYGAHQVSDGQYEARTVTPAMQEGSFSFVQTNARFYISVFAKTFNQKAKEAQIVSQIKYQSKKSLEALARRVALQFYGFSTGIVAKTTTNATATTQTLTLNDGFGDSTIDTSAYLLSLFEVGDRVAGLDASNSNALLSNALGEITSKTTDALVVVFDGSVDFDSGDILTFANGVTDTTITASDYNKWTTGLLDITTSSALLGLTHAQWVAALNDTNGGRFGRAKLKKAKQEISNDGGGKADMIVWSQGVENDVEAGEAQGRIYDSSAFDIDQSVKAKGMTIKSSPLVPSGHAFVMDSSGWGKKILTEKPSEDGMLDWSDLYKAEDRSGFKGGFDFIWSLIPRNRGKFARYASLTEQ